MKGNNGKRRNGMSWLSVLLIVAMLTPMFSAIALAEEYEVEAPAVEAEYELAYEEPLQETEVELYDTEAEQSEHEETSEPQYDMPADVPEAQVDEGDEVDISESQDNNETDDNVNAEGNDATVTGDETVEATTEGVEAEDFVESLPASTIFDFDALDREDFYDKQLDLLEEKYGLKMLDVNTFESMRRPDTIEEFTDALPLYVTAVLTDGTKVEYVPIIWKCDDEFLYDTKDYDPEGFGFTAELDKESEEYEYEVDSSKVVMPHVTLFVSYVSEIEPIDQTEYVTGYNQWPATADMAASLLNFPKEVTVLLKTATGDKELNRPVIWECDNYADNGKAEFTARFDPRIEDDVNGLKYLVADDQEMPTITLTKDDTFAFEFDKKNGTATITGWKGGSDELKNIPERIAGYDVTEIGQYAFSGHPELRTIEVPRNITKIGRGAFADCPYLTFVTLTDDLTDVDNNIFDTQRNSALSVKLAVYGGDTTLTNTRQFKHNDNTISLNCDITSLEVHGNLTVDTDFTLDEGGSYNSIEVEEGATLTLKDHNIYNKSGGITVKGTFVNNGKVYGCYTGNSVEGIPDYITSHTDKDGSGYCEICEQLFNKNEKKLTIKLKESSKGKLTKPFDGTTSISLTKDDFEAFDPSGFYPSDVNKVWLESVDSSFAEAKAGSNTVTAKFKPHKEVDCVFNYTLDDLKLEGKIEPLKLTSDNCTIKIDAPAYIDKAVEPDVEVRVELKNSTTKLVKDTDYTLTLANNDKPGKATATIEGKGNYTGTLTQSFVIARGGKVGMSYIGAVKPYKTYDGSNAFTVNQNDFSYTGVDSVEPCAITATSDSAAAGENNRTITVKTTINGTYVAECTIEGATIYPRNIAGNDIAIQTRDEDGKSLGVNVKLSYKDAFGDDVPLVKDRDYKLSSKVKDDTTTTLTIKGIGNFTGTKTLDVKKSSDLKKMKLTVEENYEAEKLEKEYDGTKKTKLTLSDFKLVTKDIPDEDVGQVKLIGIAAEYADKNVGDQPIRVKFELSQPENASYEYVVDPIIKDEAKIKERVITIYPLPGQYKIYGTPDPKTLNAYYKGTLDDENIEVTGELTREEGDDRGEYGYTTDNLLAGKNYTFVIAGEEDDEDSDEEEDKKPNKSEKFTIRPKNLASADITVKFDAEVYRTRDEKAVEPDITVTYHAYDGDKELEEGTDYEVKFTDNTKRGTGHAIITAVNSEECNYTGTRVADFRIKKEHSGGSGSSSSSSYEEEDDEDDDGDDDGEDDQDTIKDGQLVLGDDENRIDIGFILCGDDNKARPFKNRDYPDIEDIEETDPETGETTAPVAFDADGNPILPKRLTIEPEPFPASYDENNEIIPRQMDSNPERDKYEALHLRLNQEQVNKLKAEHITELVFKVEERAEFRVPLDALTFEVDVDRLNKTDTDEESSEETEEEWGEGDASSDEEDSEESEGEIEEYDGEPEGDGLEDESDSEDGATITPNLVPVYTYEMVIEQLEDVNLTAREENAFEDKFSMLPLYRVKMSAVDNELVIYPNDSEVQPSTIEAENTYYPMLGYLENVEYRIDEYLLKTPGDGEVDTLPKSAQMLYVSSDENLSDEDAIVLGEAEYVVTGDEPYALFSNGKDGLYTIVVDKDWTEEDEESEDEEYEDTEDEEFEDEDIEESSEEAEEAELEDEPEEVEPVVEEEPEEQLVEDPDPVYAYSRKSNAGDQYWLIDTQNKTVEYYRGDTNTYMIGDYSGSLMSGMAVTFRTNPPETTTIQLKFKQTYKFAMMDDAGVSLLMEQDDIGAVQSTMSSHRQ